MFFVGWVVYCVLFTWCDFRFALLSGSWFVGFILVLVDNFDLLLFGCVVFAVIVGFVLGLIVCVGLVW